MRRRYLMASVNERRVRIVYNHGARGYIVRWTQACSGCVDGPLPLHAKCGSGCHECGWTGVRRRAEWCALNESEGAKWSAALRREAQELAARVERATEIFAEALGTTPSRVKRAMRDMRAVP